MLDGGSQVDLLVLGVLSRGPVHGYGLVEAIRKQSGESFDLAEGTVCPALYRLERQGVIESKWERGSKRKRRVYRHSQQGASQLEVDRKGWLRQVMAMRAVLE